MTNGYKYRLKGRNRKLYSTQNKIKKKCDKIIRDIKDIRLENIRSRKEAEIRKQNEYCSSDQSESDGDFESSSDNVQIQNEIERQEKVILQDEESQTQNDCSTSHQSECEEKKQKSNNNDRLGQIS